MILQDSPTAAATLPYEIPDGGQISEDIGCHEVAYVVVTRRVDGVSRTAATLTRALQAVQDVPIGADKT